jgi:two-component system, NarL family, response regulator DevR
MKAVSRARTSTTPIRVALVEDHTLLRESIKAILNDKPRITVVGDAANRADGLAMIKKVKPDILVQDIRLGQDDGLMMLREVKDMAPGTRCLVLTGFTEDNLMLRAIRQSADGFLLKSCSMPVLVKAIRQVAGGQPFWDQDTLARLAGIDTASGLDAKESGLDSLTSMEQRIAGYIAEGLTNREIGNRVHLAEKTIRNRISIIMDKLQVTRRSKIAALFTQNAERIGEKKCLSLNALSPSMMTVSQS